METWKVAQVLSYLEDARGVEGSKAPWGFMEALVGFGNSLKARPLTRPADPCQRTSLVVLGSKVESSFGKSQIISAESTENTVDRCRRLLWVVWYAVVRLVNPYEVGVLGVCISLAAPPNTQCWAHCHSCWGVRYPMAIRSDQGTRHSSRLLSPTSLNFR